MSSLKNLEEKVHQHLKREGICLTHPSRPLDVAIIGAGQLGLSLWFALQKRKIYEVALFDQAAPGEEGPWGTVARMRVLRTPKQFADPSLGFVALSFRSYAEAMGVEWKSIDKIPTPLWAGYLQWFKTVLHIPVHSESKLISLLPENDRVVLHFEGKPPVTAKKVVLATGRAGSGGLQIPSFVKHLPPDIWFHSGQKIDAKILFGKRICVVGCAASAFDLAAFSLEHGAKEVRMLMRRHDLPAHNLLGDFKEWKEFFFWEDEKKIELVTKAKKAGTCPPLESIERLKKWKNFSLHPDTSIEKILYDKELFLHTNQGLFSADLLLLGTGYTVDLSRIGFLSAIQKEILLWKDKHPQMNPQFENFPYLGPHFEFLAKNEKGTSSLRNIYSFNVAAFVSHGRIAGDIDVLPIGMERITQGLEKALL